MQEVEVDAVGLQSLQAALAGGDRSLAACVPWIDLADEEDVVAPAGDRLPNHLLGAAFSIHFRPVYQRHAEIDAVAERLDLAGGTARVLAHLPGSEAKPRNNRTGGKGDGGKSVVDHDARL